ncbi:hypothetical protein RYZ51_25680, partial [Escherichia coli]|uniref:hypothetical protein n=1 Tax=Escherichia coli TaxID=562 RepID=UPI0029654AA7
VWTERDGCAERFSAYPSKNMRDKSISARQNGWGPDAVGITANRGDQPVGQGGENGCAKV